MKKITKNTNIIKALEINPEADKILMDAGLGCIGCAFANIETLGQGLTAHGFNKNKIKQILKKLNKK